MKTHFFLYFHSRHLRSCKKQNTLQAQENGSTLILVLVSVKTVFSKSSRVSVSASIAKRGNWVISCQVFFKTLPSQNL